jgi:hypothetical protein
MPVIPMLLGLYGFGFAFAALVLVMREANTMVDMSSFLLQIFSGSNFPVNSLPKWLLPISLALPLTYGLDAVRGYLLKTPPSCRSLGAGPAGGLYGRDALAGDLGLPLAGAPGAPAGYAGAALIGV